MLIEVSIVNKYTYFEELDNTYCSVVPRPNPNLTRPKLTIIMNTTTWIIAFVSLIVIYFVKIWSFWCRSSKCLIGKTAIITGGASGIGYQTTLALASKGCRVIIADVAKATVAADKVKEITHNPNVIGKFIDLRSFKSVRAFANEILTTETKLDILLCNAGIGDHRIKHVTEDGLDVPMQLNHLSHFLLIHLLLGLLKKSAPSRFVLTSSLAAYFTTFTVDEMNPPAEYYQQWKTKLVAAPYSNAKLAMAAATRTFAQKLQGTGVTANAYHPGIVKTPLIPNAVSNDKNHILGSAFLLLAYLVGRSPEAGAQPLIHLAQCDSVKNVTGQSFVEGHRFFKPPQLSESFCDQLWDASIKLAGLKPEELGC